MFCKGWFTSNCILDENNVLQGLIHFKLHLRRKQCFARADSLPPPHPLNTSSLQLTLDPPVGFSGCILILSNICVLVFVSVFSLYFLLTVFHVIVISSHCSFLCCIFIPLCFILLYLHLVVFSTSWFLHLLSFYPTVFSSCCIFILPPVPFSTLFGSKMSFPVSHNPLPDQLSLFLICIVLFKCATTLPIRWILFYCPRRNKPDEAGCLCCWRFLHLFIHLNQKVTLQKESITKNVLNI